MSDISLLPEEMRGKEEAVSKAKKPAPSTDTGGLKMHVPDVEPDENIEIIEVDEGDLAAVLKDEPFMTRMTYQLSSIIDKVKDQLFKKKEAVPPPKLPPQFFKPPKGGLVTAPSKPEEGSVTKPAATQKPGEPKARITPQAETPRRVRVIRRVKKPVRVSLISKEELAALNVDVGKRKWTLAIVTIVFLSLLGAGWYLLDQQIQATKVQLADVNMQVADVRGTIDERLETWSQYEDLEERLTLLDKILDEHVVISRVFDLLELRTLPSVSYRGASWSDSGELILDVITDSYSNAAQQLVLFDETESVLDADAAAFSSRTSEGGEDEAPSTEVTFSLILDLDMDRLRGPELVTDVDAMDTGDRMTTSTAMRLAL
ncbi:hypothetical protein GF380_06635 [Candidatus Uhrbacteria bacterium]|nr:hypothetical protein [Candidatus Uhrbacteria bacterium]MBD3284611.1 hypothetical protein [Candidatus Uhrbacteria bacterium]